jgi:hypothetical protein
MDNKSTYGLKLEQLADLFSIGADEENHMDDIGNDKAAADLLRNQLTGTLPKDSFLLDSVLTMMGSLGCDVRSLAGKSLGEVLLNPKSDIGLLRAIKDYSKQLSCSSTGEAETAVATTIYYAALASSLIYHDKKITQYSYETLDRSFAMLASKEWMASELVRLFSRARGVCQDKRGVEWKQTE